MIECSCAGVSTSGQLSPNMVPAEESLRLQDLGATKRLRGGKKRVENIKAMASN